MQKDRNFRLTRAVGITAIAVAVLGGSAAAGINDATGLGGLGAGQMTTSLSPAMAATPTGTNRILLANQDDSLFEGGMTEWIGMNVTFPQGIGGNAHFSDADALRAELQRHVFVRARFVSGRTQIQQCYPVNPYKQWVGDGTHISAERPAWAGNATLCGSGWAKSSWFDAGPISGVGQATAGPQLFGWQSRAHGTTLDVTEAGALQMASQWVGFLDWSGYFGYSRNTGSARYFTDPYNPGGTTGGSTCVPTIYQPCPTTPTYNLTFSVPGAYAFDDSRKLLAPVSKFISQPGLRTTCRSLGNLYGIYIYGCDKNGYGVLYNGGRYNVLASTTAWGDAANAVPNSRRISGAVPGPLVFEFDGSYNTLGVPGAQDSFPPSIVMNPDKRWARTFNHNPAGSAYRHVLASPCRVSVTEKTALQVGLSVSCTADVFSWKPGGLYQNIYGAGTYGQFVSNRGSFGSYGASATARWVQ